MPSVGKSKISINREINPFSESKGKEPPVWLYFAKSEANKIKPMSFKRDMLLDARKWKAKDINDGIYAVARYELAIFDAQLGKIEKDLIKKVNAQTKKKFKKSEDILDMPDLDKNKTVQKIITDCAKMVIKSYDAMVKKVDDKVSLALDEVEADKGDNKKSLSSCKEALKKFKTTDIKGTYVKPADQAKVALKELYVALAAIAIKKEDSKGKDSKSKDSKGKDDADLKGPIDTALKKLKDAESDFESKSKNVRGVLSTLMEVGDKLADDMNADPAVRELGSKFKKKSSMYNALKALDKRIDILSKQLDDDKNEVSAKKNMDAKDAQNVGNAMLGRSKSLSNMITDISKEFNTAKAEVDKFGSEYKSVSKELSK